MNLQQKKNQWYKAQPQDIRSLIPNPMAKKAKKVAKNRVRNKMARKSRSQQRG